MHLPLPLLLGLRYALARRRRGYVSFISAVAMLGLVLGTAVLIVVLSVLNGFEREMRERVLGVVPHLLIEHAGGFADWDATAKRLAGIPGVRAIAPLVGGPVLIATAAGVRAAELAGVDPAAEARVSIVAGFIEDAGKGSGLTALRAGEFQVLLGARLADALHVRRGDNVNIVLPQAAVTPLGVFPRQKRFHVVGIVRTGSELDDRAIYTHIGDAQRLYRLGDRVPRLRVRLDDLFAVREVGRALLAQLPDEDVQAQGWTQTQGPLYRAILLQRTTMLVLLSLVIAVAAFNVIASLVMIVTDKQGEIAILRSLGLSTRKVMGSFVALGAIVGLVGTGLGAVIGALVALSIANIFSQLQARLHLHLLDQYFVHYLPSQLRWFDVVLVCGIALALTLLASLYPARRAARVLPAEVLRYE